MGADDNLRPRAARQVAQGWNVLSKTDHIAAGKNTTMEHYLKVVHTTYLIGSGCAPALPRRRPRPAHAPSPPLPPWCAPRVAAPALMHPHLRSRHRRARPRSSRGSRGKNLETYQYTVNNNNYEDGESLPAAVFSYDVSPMQAASRPALATASHGCTLCTTAPSASVTASALSLAPPPLLAPTRHRPCPRPQVMVQEERESFAAFLTQLCAIIGGVFTVTG